MFPRLDKLHFLDNQFFFRPARARIASSLSRAAAASSSMYPAHMQPHRNVSG
jgi:hypothetical protein